MILTILNQTFSTLSYQVGTVSVAASSSFTASQAQIYPLCRDAQLVSDCSNGLAFLFDGVNEYAAQGALVYLNQIASSLSGAVVGFQGAPAPAFEITVGGKDSSGKSQAVRMDQFANLAVNFRNSFKNIAGNATTVVKSGAGTLHSIMINNSTTGGTITIYDNTAGSGVIIATQTLGTTGAPSHLGPLGIEFTTGLTIVTAGSTSNNVTAVYQ